jgi:hypothetical protein
MKMQRGDNWPEHWIRTSDEKVADSIATKIGGDDGARPAGIA